MLDYKILKRVLFLFQPETAHNIVEILLRALPKVKIINNLMVEKNFILDTKLSQEINGIKFLNPVGLAAGFDKNAHMVKSIPALGFGFTEIGTVTPRSQEGNPKPRMFRYPKYNSIQNAMGFNNLGSSIILTKLKKVYPFTIPIGVNIGKNKSTPEEYALLDYKTLIRKFKNTSDYLVINISSPNTPNLRDLQNEKFITELFTMAKNLTNKPIFLKISPDIKIDTAINLCNTAVKAGAAGIIATNTSTDYTLIPNSKNFGGLSGLCLKEKSGTFFKILAKQMYGKTTLISVGGISTAKEAYERLKAGASLVQCYSGLIFEGPSMVKKINKQILELMKENGYNNILEVIGSDLK